MAQCAALSFSYTDSLDVLDPSRASALWGAILDGPNSLGEHAAQHVRNTYLADSHAHAWIVPREAATKDRTLRYSQEAAKQVCASWVVRTGFELRQTSSDLRARRTRPGWGVRSREPCAGQLGLPLPVQSRALNARCGSFAS